MPLGASVLARALVIAGLANVPLYAMAISPARDGCRTRVAFEPNSSVLQDAAFKGLNQFVMECQTYGRTVVVTGYPDDREESRSGLQLAKARAESVRKYLLSTGILAKSVQAESDYGVSLTAGAALSGCDVWARRE
jgi:hypothetical protein